MLLQLRNISFGFSRQEKIFTDFSLDLEQNKIYALMGSNGSGKTTLFNIITGYLKTQTGTILFNAHDITRQKPYQISRLGISRTFQNNRLITTLSVKENIILAMKGNPTDNWLYSMAPAQIYNDSNRRLSRMADEIGEQFFLSEVMNSKADEISYGQQKLLSIACCVAAEASLLLIDEPVAGIQPEYRNKIAIILKKLQEQHKTILIVEHNPDFISEIAENIFFLNEGQLSAFANMETLRKDKNVMEAYI